MKALSLSLIVILLLFSNAAFSGEPSQTHQEEWVQAVTPADNSELIGKKPEIRIGFPGPALPATLLVMLDGVDVTPMLALSGLEARYTPVLPLSPGAHTLILMAVDASGGQLLKTVTFRSRQSKAFEEISSANNASVMYTQAVVKPEPSAGTIQQSQTPQPPTTAEGFNGKLEGNIQSENRIKNGPWEAELKGNVRFLYQDLPAPEPLDKGFDLANWIMTGTYTRDKARLQASVGDIQVLETANTISLSRKGGLLQFDYDNLQLRAFSLMGQDVFGLNGGLGIGYEREGHILGASAGLKLFDNKAGLKAVYVTGEGSNNPSAISIQPQPGIPPDPYGTSNLPGVKRGDVVGFQLTTDFFESKAQTEMEADFSRFDPDISDEFGSKNDSAWLLRAFGVLDKYNYDARYEYFGRDFGTIGNLGALRDREGVTVSQGLNLEKHAFLLNLSGARDNVRDDVQFPRIYQYTGSFNYTFTGIENLSAGIGLQKTLLESHHEPPGSQKLDMMVDTLSATAGYAKDKWFLGVSGLLSLLNDRTALNADTTTMTFTVTPAYTTPDLTVTPVFSWNRTKIHSTGLWTDSLTGGLNLYARLSGERLFFDAGGTYTKVKADDSSVDLDQTNVTANLSYSLKGYLGSIEPTVTLRNTYINTRDRVNPSAESESYGLFLLLTANAPFLL